MANKYWYEVRPHILEKEVQLLRDAGVAYEIDPTVLQFGIIRIDLVIEPDNPNFNLLDREESLRLIAVYPDSYPFFRPLVYAPELELARHQNPIEKNVCLLGRATFWWNSSSNLVAHLQEQLPKLLEKGNVTDPEIIKNDETEQAEPVSEYYAAADQSILFNKSVFSDDELKDPKPRLLGNIKIGQDPNVEGLQPRLAVLETIVLPDFVIDKAPEVLHQTFTKSFSGQLYRIPGKPPNKPEGTSSWLEKLLVENGERFNPPNIDVPLNNGLSIKRVIGLCFEEEQQRGINGFGWLFHVTLQQKAPAVKKGEKHNPPTLSFSYARAANLFIQSNSRAPKLAPLVHKKAGIVGLGALGSFIAIELARSGIGALNLMDNDIVEPATTIRWPFGIQIAGQQKALIINGFINGNYPGTSVKSLIWQLGSYRVNMQGLPLEHNQIDASVESEQLNHFFEGLSIVIDATTEFGVHHLLSVEAKKRNIPYICVYASPGAYGGSVMRQLPGKGKGCWSCFMNMEADGKLPLVHEDTSSEAYIQPPGCGDITFTGANVDLQQISLAASRLAISTLCKGETGGYPDHDWDIARVNLFENDGSLVVPQWQTFTLPIHADCHYCN